MWSNRWKSMGWLFFTRCRRLQLERGDILPLDEYFHLDGSSTEDPYATFPTFRTGHFRTTTSPPLWLSETNSRLVLYVLIELRWTQSSFVRGHRCATSSVACSACFIFMNKTCRISNSDGTTQVAHLYRRIELDWVQRNSMGTYSTSRSVPANKQLDDTGNALLLREDLFDKNKFVFVPKIDEGKQAMVIHVLDLS